MTMIRLFLISLFNLFSHFYKVIIQLIFINHEILLKPFLILLLLSIILLIYKFPSKKPEILENICDYYKIHTIHDKIWCYSMIIIYISIFVAGIFFLRFNNFNKTLDLKLLYKDISLNVLNNSLYSNILNIILIILMILFYILILKKLMSFFKRYFYKIHIYYSYIDEENWYENIMIGKFFYKHTFNSVVDLLIYKWEKLNKLEMFNNRIRYHIITLGKKFHYICLFFVLTYDIVYNNYTLSNIYNILPYVFIFDIWIRLTNLYNSMFNLYSAEYTAHDFIYAQHFQLISEKEVCLDHVNYYEIESIAQVMLVYMKYDLNGKLLFAVKEGRIDKGYNYDYYMDYKLMDQEEKEKIKKRTKRITFIVFGLFILYLICKNLKERSQG